MNSIEISKGTWLFLLRIGIICLIVSLFNLKIRWKIIKFLQIIGFSTLFILMFTTKIIPEQIWVFLMGFISLPFICSSIILRQWIPTLTSKPINLEEKVINDLKLTTKTSKKKFPKKLRWLGGFVIPGIPFFSVINKGWKKKLTKEAIIHENVHLHYLQNGAFLLYIGAFMLFSEFIDKLLIYGFFKEMMLLFFVVSCFVFFEYITFRKTNILGKKYNVKTRVWNKENTQNYYYLYSFQILILYGIYMTIKLILKWLT